MTSNITWEEFVNLKKGLEKSNNDLDNLKTNLDQFFLIVMGMIVYCKYIFILPQLYLLYIIHDSVSLHFRDNLLNMDLFMCLFQKKSE